LSHQIITTTKNTNNMTNNKIANRKNIANYFGTDQNTTHRILMNTNYGFFRNQFGDDAEKMWSEAHPFLHSAYPSIDYTSMSIDFIEKHFDLFANNQFYTSGGWEMNTQTNKIEWTYKTGYIKK
jgi:hypothetical protein